MSTTEISKKRHRLGREGEHPRGDLGQLILLAVFLAVWTLDSFVFRLSTVPAASIPPVVRLVVSAAFLLGGVQLARKGHVVLHEDTVREGRLIRSGVFARVRHPIYLAALLFYAALIAATASLASMALLGGIFFFYNFIASYEEKVLLQKHGGEYQEYRRRVPKWIPRLRPAGFD